MDKHGIKNGLVIEAKGEFGRASGLDHCARAGQYKAPHPSPEPKYGISLRQPCTSVLGRRYLGHDRRGRTDPAGCDQ